MVGKSFFFIGNKLLQHNPSLIEKLCLLLKMEPFRAPILPASTSADEIFSYYSSSFPIFFFHLQPFFWLCFSYTLLLYYCSLSHIYLYYYFYLFASSLVRLYTFLFVTITYYFSIVQDFSLAFPFGFRCLTRSSNREIKPERGRKHPKTKDGSDFPMPFHAVRYVRLVAACTAPTDWGKEQHNACEAVKVRSIICATSMGGSIPFRGRFANPGGTM